MVFCFKRCARCSRRSTSPPHARRTLLQTEEHRLHPNTPKVKSIRRNEKIALPHVPHRFVTPTTWMIMSECSRRETANGSVGFAHQPWALMSQNPRFLLMHRAPRCTRALFVASQDKTTKRVRRTGSCADVGIVGELFGVQDTVYGHTSSCRGYIVFTTGNFADATTPPQPSAR